jgi:broad specificity phosphatase PhoE
MSLIIYFLRHGETTASQTGGYCGTLDPGLTSAGYQMAEDFADAYKSLPWVAVFSSPLRRAVATAKPLCEAAGIRMQLKEGLREIAYGQWEGKTPEEVNREFHDDYVRWLADPGWNAPTGGERGIDIARRSSLVLKELNKPQCRKCPHLDSTTSEAVPMPPAFHLHSGRGYNTLLPDEKYMVQPIFIPPRIGESCS